MPDILIVEDDEGLRIDLVDYLTIKGFRAIGVGSAAACLAQLETMTPDVIILDVGLPDGDGFTLTRDLRQRCGLGCGLLMLTGLATASDRITGLENGADVYLVKHATLREIEATLRSLLRRLPETAKTPMPQAGAPGNGWQLLRSEWTLIAPTGNRVALTATEVTFLEAVLAKAGTAVTRAELIDALKRPSLRFNERNLDEVVRRLRRKALQAGGIEIPIRVVYGVGYSFTGPVAVL